MVDSRKGDVMADTIDPMDRVQVVESKLDQLSTSVDHRFDQVNQRFDQVDQRFDQVDQRFDQVDQRFESLEAALVEQRTYTEFAYAKLDAKMDAGFVRADANLKQLEDRLNARIDSSVGRIERKLDQFIDVQLRTNQLVERRLRALEQ